MNSCLHLEILESRVCPSTIFVIDTANNLYHFDSATPGTLIQVTGAPITGLQGGENLLGIDFRPSTGGLYGLGSTGRLYTIGTETAVATEIALLAADPTDATNPFTALSGTNFGFDFNPTVDRIRVVSDIDQNLRINPDTGEVITDGTLAYVAGDLNAAANPRVEGAAYANNFGGATATTLYGIDVGTNALVIQNPPASGTLSTVVGVLGVDPTAVAGFDIRPGTGTAFAAMNVAPLGETLYTINLTLGTATPVGTIGNGLTAMRGMAVQSRFVWDGGGGDADWSTGANWVGDVAPSTEGDLLFFPQSAAQKTNNNDLIAGALVHSLHFSGEGYDISGSAISLSNGIETTGGLAGTNTLDLDLTLTASQTFTLDSFVAFDLSGNVDLGASILTVDSLASETTFSGDWSGAGGIVSEVSLPLILQGSNSYTGDTVVAFGRLLARTSTSASQNVVESTGLLGGDGTTGPIIGAGGTIAPGLDLTTGILTVAGDVSLDSDTRFSVRLEGPTLGTDYDQLAVNGMVALGNSKLRLNLGFAPSVNDEFMLIDNDGAADAVVGTFDGLPEGAHFNLQGRRFEITYAGGDGNDVVLTALATLNPATFPDAKTATYTDVDGDLVTIKVSKGQLDQNDFLFIDEGLGFQLQTLNLFDLAPATGFAGANVSVTAKRTAIGGNGFVNVGFFDGGLNSFGNVVIMGDLGKIVAGNFVNALGSLKVQSLGQLGIATQQFGGDLVSDLDGNVGSFKVAGNVRNADVTIDGTLGSLFIGASLIGGDAGDSGRVFVDGAVKDVTIKGDVSGGDGDNSGFVLANSIKKLTVGGSLLGDDGVGSGSIVADGTGTNTIDTVTIAGDIDGDAGANSGSLFANDRIKKVTVNGNVFGGASPGSGSIQSTVIDAVTILGDLVGGGGGSAGSIAAFGAAGKLGAVTVKGSVFGGATPVIFSPTTIGDIKIDVGLIGGSSGPAQIVATGVAAPTAKTALAIKSVTVKGNIEFAEILAGYDFDGDTPLNADVQIGKVKVGGDWVESSIAAGVDYGADDVFGTADDDNAALLGGGTATVMSRIAEISITGQILGTPLSVNGADHFGFVAEQIGKLKIGATTIPLPGGIDNFLISPTQDVRVREDV